MNQFSIIRKSQLEGAQRLDAEYYQPEYLAMSKKIKSMSSTRLGDIAFITDGEHGSPIWDENSGIKYFSSQFVNEGSLATEDIRFINTAINERNKRTQLKEGNILLSIVGKIGMAGIVKTGDLPANTDRNVATIKILDNKYLPEYITTFLNSKYGRFQTFREVAGNVQPIVILSKIRDFIIPNLSKGVQESILTLFNQFIVFQKTSYDLYTQAENLLLEELGLKDFQISEDLSFIVNYSDTEKVGRVDADYFQPKYQIISEKIKSRNAKLLGKLVTLKKGFEPGSEKYQEEGKLFIRVSSLSKNGIENKDQKYLSDELYQKLKPDYEPEVGEILLTKDATPGIAYVVKELVEGIISGGILRLKLKGDIEPEYLALCINSMIGRMQAERDVGGSVILHWKPEQIKNILVPVLPKSTQQKIAELVQKSHEARRKSKELLEEAKRKVEEMIEKEGGN